MTVNNPNLLSVEQVAAQLGLHVRTVRAYLRSGRLKGIRIGKQYRIAREDLARLTGRGSPLEPVVRHRHVDVSSIVQVDAISKCFAATGLRLGWAVMPSYLAGRMSMLIGHVGAWAPRPVQTATAWFLEHPDEIETYEEKMLEGVFARLNKLYDGLMGMKARGLPVDAVRPQGGIYLSFRVDLIGRGFDTNEAIRKALLEDASVAVVQFQAFDLAADTGWFRMSIGAIGLDAIDEALERIESTLQKWLARDKRSA